MLTLKQSTLIDVASWEQDAEFGIFPQGARAKDAFFSPEKPEEEVLVPNKRYLFKHSRKSYPDQFWCEVIAYRIGCLLDLDVPPAFAAWNSKSQVCAALIEWFYIDGDEVMAFAGDFLQKVNPQLDRKTGSNHNLADIAALLRAFAMHHIVKLNAWRQWWADALLFDALIGNTDRHQDNWVFLFSRGEQLSQVCRIGPLFDNGTSLGHERFPSKISAWQDEDYLRYIRRGTHRVAWSLEKPLLNGHFQLLRKVISEWPETRVVLQNRIANINITDINQSLDDLLYLPAPVQLSGDRLSFVLRLLDYRLRVLKELLS